MLFFRNIPITSLLITSLLLIILLCGISAAESGLQPGQWSVEKANQWYAAQPWIVGCNFLPSTAINAVEMWQSESFDPKTIDKELALAHQWGFNSVRVFLNYVVWEAEPETLKKNFAAFLDLAEKHGLSVMPVLFDDCNFSGNVAKVGKQRDPIPGVHNSGWVASPPVAMVEDKSTWSKLKAYTQDMVKTFGNDKRIVMWDLYNEPGNFAAKIDHEDHVTLIKSTFAWAREMKPAQPLTTGIWADFHDEICQMLLDISDIVSFHGYGGKADMEARIKRCAESGRPVVCTEWLCRRTGNIPRNILPLFKQYKVAAYNWGLVEGRTQTYFPWGSKAGAPKPEIWQHDLVQADGTPYKPIEYHFFRHIILGEGDLTVNVLIPTSETKPLTWKYTENEPAQDWFETGFSDADWDTGDAPFGKEEPAHGRHPATTWTSNNLWLRRTFELTEEQIKKPGDVFLRTHFDEDAVVYINGKLAGKLSGYNAAYDDVEIMPEAVKTLQPGKNVIAVSVQNKGGGQYFDAGIVKIGTMTE